MTMDEQRARWQALRDAAEIAMQASRKADSELREAFAACARGEGGGPTDEQLAQADRLRRLAEVKAVEERAFLDSVFK